MALPLRKIDKTRLEALEHLSSLARTMSAEAKGRYDQHYRNMNRFERHIFDHGARLSPEDLETNKKQRDEAELKWKDADAEYQEKVGQAKSIRQLITSCRDYATKTEGDEGLAAFEARGKRLAKGPPQRLDNREFNIEIDGGDTEYGKLPK
ncbi:hypothetical protein [Devosia sp. RR2S18]|uniref:hypothetical protein n=1 Tax=Devosia rhizosphaerae TaxID=3049774 RepID=UPI00253FF6D5|nr:hypothetical protein [Devosia sp. RR2S18]WIJ24991.1 hypothetical protein QOV41_18580 [Devosia sp. RR2S18]